MRTIFELTIVLVVFGGAHVFFLVFLICWKFPLSYLNRLRIYDRKNLRTGTGECKESIAIRRNIRFDKNRYIAIRKSFLCMKMGYEPTDKKVDLYLKWLRFDLARKSKLDLACNRNALKKTLIDIDIDILTEMKNQLALGNLESDFYTSEYNKDHTWMRFQIFPVGVVLAFALFTLVVPIVMFYLSSAILAPIGTAMIGILAAENVLSRSRNKTMRWLAYFVQVPNIIGIFWLMLFMLVGASRGSGLV